MDGNHLGSIVAVAHPAAAAHAELVLVGGDARTHVPVAGAASLEPRDASEGMQNEPSSVLEPQGSRFPEHDDIEDGEHTIYADDLRPAANRLPNVQWKQWATHSGSIRDVLKHVRRVSSSEEVATDSIEHSGELECTLEDRVRILWMKALWYATQEAKRRRAANIAWRKQQRKSKAKGFTTLIEHTGIVSLFLCLF